MDGFTYYIHEPIVYVVINVVNIYILLYQCIGRGNLLPIFVDQLDTFYNIEFFQGNLYGTKPWWKGVDKMGEPQRIERGQHPKHSAKDSLVYHLTCNWRRLWLCKVWCPHNIKGFSHFQAL